MGHDMHCHVEVDDRKPIMEQQQATLALSFFPHLGGDDAVRPMATVTMDHFTATTRRVSQKAVFYLSRSPSRPSIYDAFPTANAISPVYQQYMNINGENMARWQ